MTDQTPTKRYPLAIFLWFLVGAGLLYGISQTVIKATALFTG